MKQIILDVDTGIDDALAIVYAIKSSELDVKGITTGFGNVSAEQATLNTLKVIELAEPESEIPVAMGAKKPLSRPRPNPVVHVHGNNGIGDTELPDPKQQILDEHAADFMVRMVNENPNKITLVFVGRQTNLALALEKDPSLVNKAELVLMGGALKTSGNVTPYAEANIYGDPEAAKIVFDSGIPITMVGLDATKRANFQEKHLEVLEEKLNHNLKLKQFLGDIIRFGFDASEKMNEGRQRLMHDPLAIGAVINPGFVTTENYLVQIETNGDLTTGSTLTDLRELNTNTDTNTAVCLDVKKEQFIMHFINTVAK